jgi:large subunit ribosomal protein L17
MRHRNGNKKIGVKSAHRIALLRNLARSLVIHKRIQTTVLKAKEASSFADKMVELAKKGDLHSRRLLISRLGCPDTVDKLIEEIAPRFKDRQGGYTRVIRTSIRPGDSAQKAILEFTEIFEAPKKPKKSSKKATSKKEADSEKADTKKSPKSDEASNSESEEIKKKGGFLGTLRGFLKGDES